MTLVVKRGIKKERTIEKEFSTFSFYCIKFDLCNVKLWSNGKGIFRMIINKVYKSLNLTLQNRSILPIKKLKKGHALKWETTQSALTEW